MFRSETREPFRFDLTGNTFRLHHANDGDVNCTTLQRFGARYTSPYLAARKFRHIQELKAIKCRQSDTKRPEKSRCGQCLQMSKNDDDDDKNSHCDKMNPQ